MAADELKILNGTLIAEFELAVEELLQSVRTLTCEYVAKMADPRDDRTRSEELRKGLLRAILQGLSTDCQSPPTFDLTFIPEWARYLTAPTPKPGH